MFAFFTVIAASADMLEKWKWLLARIIPEMDRALRKSALFIVHNPTVVDDILQDTYIAGALHCHQLRSEDKLFQWLYTIMKRKAGEYAQRLGNAHKLVSLHDWTYIPDSAPSMDELMVDKERVEHWKRAFSQLGDSTQQILWLRFGADMTLVEIAAQLGMNYHTAKSKYRRAKIALLSDYKEGDNDE